MAKFFSLIIVGLLFSLAGNAQSGKTENKVEGESKLVKVNSVHPIPGKHPGKSFVYIYRTSSNSGGSVPIKLKISTGEIIAIGNNASYALEVVPGEVTMVSQNLEEVHKNASIKLNVEKGKNYCVWVGFEKFAEIGLNETDEETAKIMMNK